jgi:5-methylcytosine-specific restriction endonuclease McrA
VEGYKKYKIMNKDNKKIIFKKTDGRCHFCAKRLKFDAKPGTLGRWQIDHVHPRKRGGKDAISNFLPICGKCNRLRWYLDPKRIRKVFSYGIIAFRQVKNNTVLGQQLKTFYSLKKVLNKKRREIKI